MDKEIVIFSIIYAVSVVFTYILLRSEYQQTSEEELNDKVGIEVIIALFCPFINTVAAVVSICLLIVKGIKKLNIHPTNRAFFFINTKQPLDTEK